MTAEDWHRLRNERDALMEKLKAAREEVYQMLGSLGTAHEHMEGLRKQLKEAHREIDRLRGRGEP